MIIKKLESFYIISKIKEHEKNKDKLLKLIENIPKTSIQSKKENISHSDWNLPKDFEREYLNFFYDIIKPYMNDIMKSLYCSSWNIQNGWFQQYVKDNKHEWHNHQKTNFSNIYYLEMPDKNMKTEFYNILTKKIITFDLKEGDLLTFPAYILHRSKKIKSLCRKTIISFNSNFVNVNL
jgi:hypothetical protein